MAVVATWKNEGFATPLCGDVKYHRTAKDAISGLGQGCLCVYPDQVIDCPERTIPIWMEVEITGPPTCSLCDNNSDFCEQWNGTHRLYYYGVSCNTHAYRADLPQVGSCQLDGEGEPFPDVYPYVQAIIQQSGIESDIGNFSIVIASGSGPFPSSSSVACRYIKNNQLIQEDEVVTLDRAATTVYGQSCAEGLPHSCGAWDATETLTIGPLFEVTPS